MLTKTTLNEPLLRDTLLEREIALETRAVEEGVDRYRKAAEDVRMRGDAACLKPAERFMLHWFTPLRDAIQEEVASVRRGEASIGRVVYGPLLMSVDADSLAVITMHEALGALLMEPGGMRFSYIAHIVGKSVMAQANRELLAQSIKEHNRGVRDRDGDVSEYHWLTKKLRSLNTKRINYFANKELDDPVHGARLAVHTGSRLIWLMIQTASAGGYDEPFRLAIHHKRQRIRSTTGKDTGKRQAFLQLDESVVRMVEEGHLIRQHLRPRYYPMVVEPFKWSSDAQGGYVRIRTPLVIKISNRQRSLIGVADMKPMYECMDAVASTPWRVNRRLLDVAEAVWKGGGDERLGIPRADDEPMPPRLDDDADINDIRKRKRERADAYERNIRAMRDRQQFIRKCDLARELGQEERFWYPHQLDFRGRTYPIPQILNHQGDDLCRGLLEFADARPVTSDAGREALMIEVANAYGVDKVPYSERVEWAADHAGQIARSALTPLDEDWWVKADAPWQCLAACMALADPEAAAHAVTRRDGTCNGLQNYAALGRDADAAAMVNMLPADRPNDIYSIVAERLKTLLAEDRQSPHAAKILPLVGRKTTKATVMTVMYGVTAVGARKQAHAFLEEAGYSGDKVYDASRYLSAMTLRALGDLASGAVQIMDWLADCARVIAKGGRCVEWTTPIGFPVVQSYRRSKTTTIFTIAQAISFWAENDDMPVWVRKQVNSMPPNFIHSIDKCHMFMTARACREAGIAFAGVHDNFWTHAEDRLTQDRILREKFVALHDRPILTALHEQLQTQATKPLPEPPGLGLFDIRSVLDAPYFFS